MAAPSCGSVPAPSSSSRISEQLSASRSMRTMREMWLENVDRLCCRLCSSPMSAWTRAKTASMEPSSAGTNRPAVAMSDSSPAVLSATVLPPVFGPVMSSRSNSSPRSSVIGTTSPRNNGWRALSSLSTGCSGRPRQRHELGGCGALLFGERRAGSRQVKLCQAFDAREQRVRLLADGLTQRAQDAFDFVLLVQTQCSPAVAHLDHRQWFDKQRRAAGGLVVDDAGHLATRFGANGDDVASGALRDDRVLHGVAERRGAHQVAQSSDQAVVGAAQLGSDATERRAGGVEDLAVFAERVVDVLDQAGVIAQVDAGELQERGALVAKRSQAVPPGARAAHRGRDVQQLLRREHAADAGPLGERTNVVDATQVQARPQAGQR